MPKAPRRKAAIRNLASVNVQFAGRCPENGKVQFYSRDDAKRYRRKKLANGGDVSDIQDYLCLYCGYIHMGHPQGETRGHDKDIAQRKIEEKEMEG